MMLTLLLSQHKIRHVKLETGAASEAFELDCSITTTRMNCTFKNILQAIKNSPGSLPSVHSQRSAVYGCSTTTIFLLLSAQAYQDL